MDLNESITNQAEVSLTLFTNILSQNNTNVVFSPPSIQFLLGLIASGSIGPTQEEILSFLKSECIEKVNELTSYLVNLVFSDGSPLGGPKLYFVNGVWVDQSMSLEASFKQTIENVYKAHSHIVDFPLKYDQVRNEVNQWVKNHTNGLIKGILPQGSVRPSTRLILANALYFKGAWDYKFDASLTKDHEFHLLNGNSVRVPFMTSTKMQYVSQFHEFKVLSQFHEFKVLGLPYKQGENKSSFTMYIFLPNAKDGLPTLLNRVGSESGFIDGHLPHRKVQVNKFLIPKFKIDFQFEASKFLKSLGMVSMFSGGKLHVSSFFHKAFIEVNEEGTEAAAASAAVAFITSGTQCYKANFVADHPFLFVIRENKTGVLLFTGQLFNPSS